MRPEGARIIKQSEGIVTFKGDLKEIEISCRFAIAHNTHEIVEELKALNNNLEAINTSLQNIGLNMGGS